MSERKRIEYLVKRDSQVQNVPKGYGELTPRCQILPMKSRSEPELELRVIKFLVNFSY